MSKALFFVILFASTFPAGHRKGLIADSSFLDIEMKIKLWGFFSCEVLEGGRASRMWLLKQQD